MDLGYWPTTFTLGIVIAAFSALLFVGATTTEPFGRTLFASSRRRGAG